MRPFAGVIDGPAKILDALEGRTIRCRQAADRHDHELRPDPVAAIGLDLPDFCLLVEGRRGDAGVEHDMPAQIETVGDVVGISEDFGLRRIFLRPVPFLVQFFGERERILHALDIATRAGIAIPVPGAADAAAGLEHDGRKAEPAQTMQHIHAGKTGAHHHGVDRCLQRPRHGAVGGHDKRRLLAAGWSRSGIGWMISPRSDRSSPFGHTTPAHHCALAVPCVAGRAAIAEPAPKIPARLRIRAVSMLT